jgi:hypothetical protein
MLCVNNYAKQYINECRTRVGSQFSAYHALVGTVVTQAGPNKPKVSAAIESFEPHFFNNLALALEGYFVHRARAIEKKDGNPLNEVRMLSASLMNNNGKMAADKTIKFDAANSVLKCKIGDKIKLTEADFTRLSSAFSVEIENKYL